MPKEVLWEKVTLAWIALSFLHIPNPLGSLQFLALERHPSTCHISFSSWVISRVNFLSRDLQGAHALSHLTAEPCTPSFPQHSPLLPPRSPLPAPDSAAAQPLPLCCTHASLLAVTSAMAALVSELLPTLCSLIFVASFPSRLPEKLPTHPEATLIHWS